MHASHYTQEENLKIYALIAEERYVYVGKTKSNNLGGIVSRHIWGRCAATRDYFEVEGAKRPKMYLLEEICATQAVGYKHVLAYISVFADEGYIVLNYQRSLDQAFDPMPDTAQIVEDIRTIPFDMLLERSYLVKPSTGHVKNTSHPIPLQSDAPTENLSVRLTPGEKDAFHNLAAALRLSQRDTVLYLINKQNAVRLGSEHWRMDQLIGRTIAHYEKKIQDLKEKNEKLKSKLDRLNPQASSSMQTEKIAFIQKGLRSYFQLFSSSTNDRLLPRGNYRRFTRALPKNIRYDYPPSEGYMAFWPERILWGKSKPPVCFILGTDVEGNRYKLRYYDKPYYAGPRINGDRFGFCDTCWYVGFRKAPDGAMDIVLSLPLNLQLQEKPTAQEKEEELPPLDSRIAEAQYW